MLKPSEVKSYEFKPAGRNAYKADDVDMFFAEVAISYEKMYRENSELIKRISLLADRLEQYKNDEVDIKQAVLSAQKAADIIIRDAQESVADSKAEAEAILSAAKGEAAVIKQDAEKQAIVDSDLLMNLAKDKAEDIINKAKEKAHGILIAANNSANDKMGAANRTITSETIHYDMLKKEVSEFRASILSQYKAHIELISKLPELAVEEASKLEKTEVPAAEIEIDEEALENPVFVEEEPEDTVLEFVVEEATDGDSDFEVDMNEYEEDIAVGEEVVKTTLPFDFFGNDSEIEFVDEGDHVDDAPADVIEDDGSIGFSRKNPLPVDDYKESEADNPVIDCVETDSISAEDESMDDKYSDDFEVEVEENVSSQAFDDALSDDSDDAEYEDEDEVFSDEDELDDNDDNSGSSYASFFESIENIDIDDLDEEKPKHRGFFRRNK